MSFRSAGLGGGIASLPGLSGTEYQYSYFDAHGKLFAITAPAAGLAVNLADLLYINNPDYTSVSGRPPTYVDPTNNRLDDLAGTTFYIVNRGTGNITFTGGGIATIVPTGATLAPRNVAIITLNPIDGGMFELVVAPL